MNSNTKMPSIPTPLYPHLNCPKFSDVYEPSEDTFLLLDALEKDASFLNQLRPLICVEVGSGSGVVLAFLAKLLSCPSFLWAIDKNPAASLCTKQTLETNGVATCADSVVMDLVTSFKCRMMNNVDVMVFNPPYVVTPPEEVRGNGIEASWAGGVNGREVIDVFLDCVPDVLSPKGVLYLVLIRENRPAEVCEIMSHRGFKNELVLHRVARNEDLIVIKFFRMDW